MWLFVFCSGFLVACSAISGWRTLPLSECRSLAQTVSACRTYRVPSRILILLTGAHSVIKAAAICCTWGMILSSYIWLTISHEIRIPYEPSSISWNAKRVLNISQMIGKELTHSSPQCRNTYALWWIKKEQFPSWAWKHYLISGVEIIGREWFSDSTTMIFEKTSIRLKSLVKLYEPQSKCRQMILDISFRFILWYQQSGKTYQKKSKFMNSRVSTVNFSLWGDVDSEFWIH